MSKKFILLLGLLSNVALTEASFFDTLFLYVRKCTKTFDYFFIVNSSKQLAEPLSKVENSTNGYHSQFLGKGCSTRPKKLSAKRNRFNSEAFLQNQNQYVDRKLFGTVDRTIGGSIAIPIPYQQVEERFELLACGKGDKIQANKFKNKVSYDSAVEETIPLTRCKYMHKVGAFRPSAEPAGRDF